MSKNIMKRNRFVAFWVVGLIINLGLILGLYFTETTIGIDDFSDNISLPLYTIIPGTLVLLGIWAITISNKIKEIQKKIVNTFSNIICTLVCSRTNLEFV